MVASSSKPKSRGGWYQSRDDVIARFERHMMPEPNSGCWIWLKHLSGRSPCFYGYVKVKGKMIGAHRRAWQLFRGRIPDGLQVLHRCDNASCVNPDHLFLGTRTTNLRQMIARGRRTYTPFRTPDGKYCAKAG
jgi:hypothetical protein